MGSSAAPGSAEPGSAAPGSAAPGSAGAGSGGAGSGAIRRLAALVGPDIALLRRSGEFRLLAVCGRGAGIAAFGFAASLWWAVAALAAAGAADMISGIFRMTMWNQTVPASLRGRLAGLEMISYTTGEPVGNLEAGLVAAATGSVRIAVVSGGAASVLGAVVVAAALPALWRFDAREHPVIPAVAGS